MARTKEPRVSEAILHALRQRQAEAPARPANAAKYPQMKELLREVLSLYSAHTRLPSIRDIAGALDTSIVTTQRALAELVSEGLLYSKERSGIFVASIERNTPPAPVSASVPRSPGSQFLSRFQFGTDSAAPYQQTFWNRLAADFQAGHPTTEPVLNYTTDSADFGSQFDLFERSAYSRHWPGDRTPLLDLTHFVTEELSPLSKDGYALPLYHRSYFLFFNRDLLKRHGIPAPDYRDFAGQTAYLEALGPRLTALGLDPRIYSIQEPVTLLGNEIERFFNLTRSPELDPAETSRLIAAIEKLVRFCRQCRYGDDGNTSWIEERSRFRQGGIPFFLGYSVDYWEFNAREHLFDLGAYPTFCVDDALFLLPILGAIKQSSVHPAESLRFMSFIRSLPVQKLFSDIGHFGGDLSSGIAPSVAADPSWILDLVPRSHAFDLTAPHAFYLAVNILNGEIWRALLDLTSAEKSTQRAIHLGRSYLRHRTAVDTSLSPAPS
ncbi:MAG TPA: GntR family transcriptional regulator [Rariglobus sp.]